MTQKRTQEQFEELVKKIYGWEYNVIGAYQNALANIYLRHNLCGRIIKMRANRFLHNEGKCKFCNKLIKKGLPLPNPNETESRILVIDNDKKFSEFCKTTLMTKFVKVETKMNPVVALDEIKTEPYDLIIIELLMLEMDGIEVMAKIREEFPITKIIMVADLSAPYLKPLEKVLSSIKFYGAYETIVKPVEPNKLRDIVARDLKKPVGKLFAIYKTGK